MSAPIENENEHNLHVDVAITKAQAERGETVAVALPDGRSVDVKLVSVMARNPHGRLRVRGKGAAGKGDLYVHLTVT